MNITVSIIIAILLAAISIYKKALTISASLLAGIIIIVIGICGNYKDVLFLTISYLILVAIDMVANKLSEQVVNDIHKKHGARTVIQVLANGGAATAAIIAYKLFDNIFFLFVYEFCVIEACADSIASDIGVLSKHEPISIVTFKKVPTGMSGGVSFLGLISSLIGCIFMAVLASFSSGITIKNIVLLTFIPYFGVIIDSILGACIQVKYKCSICGKLTERVEHCSKATTYIGGIKFIDNSAVNFITNIITGIIGYILILLFY